MSRRVTVFSREGCHLCEEALEQIAALERPDVVVEVVDIDTDDELLRRYLERIPVIALDGEELYEFRLDVADFLDRLDVAAGR